MNSTSKETTMKRAPKGFRTGHDGSIACPHRDVSCCDDCAKKHPEIVDAMGSHFWVADAVERAEMQKMIADMNARRGAW